MTIEEKTQYDIDREAAKISALSSGKIDLYEYLFGKEILPFRWSQMNEQPKFTSPLRKVFENQTRKTPNVSTITITVLLYRERFENPARSSM